MPRQFQPLDQANQGAAGVQGLPGGPSGQAQMPPQSAQQPSAQQASAGGMDENGFINQIIPAERSPTRGGREAVSPKGAKGPMQVMPTTQHNPGFGVRPAQDDSPEERMRVGRDYASAMYRRYGGNPIIAAAAYNAGPGYIDKMIHTFGMPRDAQSLHMFVQRLHPETQKYVQSFGTPEQFYAQQQQRVAQAGQPEGYQTGGLVDDPSSWAMLNIPEDQAEAAAQSRPETGWWSRPISTAPPVGEHGIPGGTALAGQAETTEQAFGRQGSAPSYVVPPSQGGSSDQFAINRRGMAGGPSGDFSMAQANALANQAGPPSEAPSAIVPSIGEAGSRYYGLQNYSVAHPDPANQGPAQAQAAKKGGLFSGPMDMKKLMTLSLMQSILPSGMGFQKIAYDPTQVVRAFGPMGGGAGNMPQISYNQLPTGSGGSAYNPLSVPHLGQRQA